MGDDHAEMSSRHRSNDELREVEYDALTAPTSETEGFWGSGCQGPPRTEPLWINVSSSVEADQELDHI